MKILEIDDNADIIKFVEMIVSGMGHDFSFVYNGKDGVRMIEENKYDLVLLDLSMPEYSGLDVIDTLVEKNLMSKQKIILFTASLLAESDLDGLMSKGVYSYLAKPIDIDELISKINIVQDGLA